MIVSTVAAQRRALFVVALTLILGVSGYITKAWAAGAFAVGTAGRRPLAHEHRQLGAGPGGNRNAENEERDADRGANDQASRGKTRGARPTCGEEAGRRA